MKFDAMTLLTTMPLKLSQLPLVEIATEDDGDGAIPAELREWLVRLRLLDGVPFAYLVADTELLPEESIRWFYVDRRWTDALMQGVLAVGTANSDDRTQLTNRYPQVRAELDNEERNLRRRAGSNRYTGESGPISGFLLRSRAVSGWPALHVRAFSIDPGPAADEARIREDQPGRMRLLRLERLAPAVLLCLFDGVPKVVHLEEPRQGVQFGFDATDDGDNVRATLGRATPPRSSTCRREPIDGAVPGRLERRRRHSAPGTRGCRSADGTGAGDGLDSCRVRAAARPVPVPAGLRRPGARPR